MTRLSSKTFLAVTLAALVFAGCNKSASVEADAQPETEVPQTLAQANMAASKAFMDDASQKDGVTVTPSGLAYEVVTEGSGEKPNAASRVTVHYEGTFPDGTVFDSSYARGETISFPLSGVIRGWTEGLQLMAPGAKYKFYIPPHLAYGMGGTPGGPIGPNQALVFTVELFSFE